MIQQSREEEMKPLERNSSIAGLDFPPPMIKQENSSNREMVAAVSLTPVIAAIVTLLVVAFLLLSYYRLVSLCYSSWILRRPQNQSVVPLPVSTPDHDDPNQQLQLEQLTILVRTSALSKSLINRLPVQKKRNCESACSDCAVCLSEFTEGEDIKILPSCKHEFHAECIDTWLSSHSTVCPLCRVKVELNFPTQAEQSDQQQQQQHRFDGSGEDPQTQNVVSAQNSGDAQFGHIDDGMAAGKRKRGSSLEDASLFRAFFRQQKLVRKHLRRVCSTSSFVPPTKECEDGLVEVVVLHSESSSSSAASSSKPTDPSEETQHSNH